MRDSHPDTGMKICFRMNMIVPKLGCAGEAWEGNAKLMEQPETVQMTSAEKLQGCSNATDIIQNREEHLERAHLNFQRPEKLKWLQKARNVPMKSFQM